MTHSWEDIYYIGKHVISLARLNIKKRNSFHSSAPCTGTKLCGSGLLIYISAYSSD